ncbi:uncharacterized protein LOC120341041 [Styela clava]
MAMQQLMFSMRIVSVDSYMADPIPGLDLERSDFRKSQIKSVPVVRVFGSTPSGQTTCLHLHGVFPYLMIPYCGPDVMDSHWTEIERYMQQLAISLDSALNSASGKGKSTRHRVFKIVLLRGIPFYGYHQDEELFLKIYFYLPGDIKRAADLLQAGAVMDRQFQAHEAHVPYILQLFLDYNLYGMNLVHAKNSWFRLPIGKPDPIDKLPEIKRPDDIENDNKEQPSNKTSVSKKGYDKDNDLKLAEKYNAPSMSQLQNFNWNLLREKAQSSYSQRQPHENDDLGDSEVLPSSSIRRASKEEDSQNVSQGFSCSNLCKTLMSKSILSNDSLESEDMLSNTLTSCMCPLHTQWTGQNVPSSSKLPVQVERHSMCDLEVDVLAADIANRDELANASTKNPGIAAIWEDERARRRERDEDSQIASNQSQLRNLPENLSEREARYIEMLYDALDRYKEENSFTSLNDSLSFSASLTSRKTSSEAGPSRRESKDLFSLSPSGSQPTSSKEGSQDTLGISPESGLTPIISQDVISQVMNSAKSQRTRIGSDMDDDVDISTLELMNKLHEDEEELPSVASQRGNGPLDVDHERQTPEDFAFSQNSIKKQLSFSISNSQKIDDLPSPLDSTFPIAPPNDDEDAIEHFEMSQRWDSAIQDLLQDLSDSDNMQISDSDGDDVAIPQLDGASDEPVKDNPTGSISTVTGERLGSTKRGTIAKSKSLDVLETEDIIPKPTDVNIQKNDTLLTSKVMQETTSLPNVNIPEVFEAQNIKVLLPDKCTNDFLKNSGWVSVDNINQCQLSQSESLIKMSPKIGKVDHRMRHEDEKLLNKNKDCVSSSKQTTKPENGTCKKVVQRKEQKVTSARTHPCSTGYVVKKKTVQEAIASIKYFGGSEVNFSGNDKNFVDILMKFNEMQTARNDPNKRNSNKKQTTENEIYGTGEEPNNIFEKMCYSENEKSDFTSDTSPKPNFKKACLNKKKINKHDSSRRKVKNDKNLRADDCKNDLKSSQSTEDNEKCAIIKNRSDSSKENSSSSNQLLVNNDINNAKTSDDAINILETKEKLLTETTSTVKKPKGRSLSESVLMKVEPRTNVFTTILNENPGVTLYDQTKAKPQKFKHSAIINLDSLSTGDGKNICSLDDTLVCITSTPVEHEANVEIDKSPSRRTRKNTKKEKDSKRSTRTRRPRSASKNTYLEDPLYETVFDSDWDSDKSETFEPIETAYSSRRTRNRRANDYRRKRNKKPKVITKWIIVNRFKGQSNMRVALWKLPLTKRVKLTPELLRLYELYSPIKGSEISQKPPSIPLQNKPRPMGKRSKHRLAILCPFGPQSDDNNSPIRVHCSQISSLENIEAIVSGISTKQPPLTPPKSISSVKTKSTSFGSQKIQVTSSSPDTVTGVENMEFENLSEKNSVSVISEKIVNSSGENNTINFEQKHTSQTDEKSLSSELCEKSLDDNTVSLKAAELTKVSPLNDLLNSHSVSSKTSFNLIQHSTEKLEDKSDAVLNNKFTEKEKDSPVDVKIPMNAGKKNEEQNVEQPEETVLDEWEDLDEDLPIAVAFARASSKLNKLTSEKIKTDTELNIAIQAQIDISENVVKKDSELIDKQRKSKSGNTETNDNQSNIVNVKMTSSELPVSLLCSEKLSDMPGDFTVENKEKIATGENLKTKLVETINEEVIIAKTCPILTSIFTKSSKPVVKKTENKKKNVKPKKEPKRKRSLVKLNRASPSPPLVENNRLSKSIVPVSSRTVEPLCNRISPDIVTSLKNSLESSVETQENERLPDFNMNTLVAEKLSPKKSKKVNPVQVTLMPHIGKLSPPTREKKSPSETDTASPMSSPEKKVPLQQTTTKRVYAPSRKVTRNSVAVKLKQISAPKCMFNTISDDSMDPAPKNALLYTGFPSPILDPPWPDIEPPRPWSPMHAPVTNNANIQDNEETESDDLLESFAESFGADATKILGLDESVFKNMDCIDQLINDNQNTDATQEADNVLNTKEEDDKLLKHFDKILENVSTNVKSASSDQLCKSETPFDAFEEETLMEFIDEMTSPTQILDSTLSESLDASLPMAPTPTQAIMESRTTPPQKTISTDANEKSNSMTSTPLPPSLPSKTVVLHNQPARPTSVLPVTMPQQVQSFHERNISLVALQNQTCIPPQVPNVMTSIHQTLPQRPASVFGTHPQHPMECQKQCYSHRPQSCRPVQHLPAMQHKPQLQRPASALGQWSGMRESHSQPTCTENHFNMRNNMVSPNYFHYNADQHAQKKPDSNFYANKNASSQPMIHPMSSYTPTPPPIPYQFHMDGGPMPIEPPLQVFHTHVHHHHHVHSINNQPDAVNNGPTPAQPKHLQPPKVKTERIQQNVKMENNPNSPWPNLQATGKVTPVQAKGLKPPEKPRTKKANFYVPNSPFPYPTTISPIQTGPKGLVQTLTYVETTMAQTFASGSQSGKQRFLAFAGVTPTQHPTTTILTQASASMNQQMAIEVPSVLLKGSCQSEHYQGFFEKRQGNSAPMVSRPKKMYKPRSRSRPQNARNVWDPTVPLPTLENTDVTKEQQLTAKTPYGLMKQNSLVALKNRSVVAASIPERKRKTISDFRTPPPNTPTISLSGNSTTIVDSNAEAFNLSQDMFQSKSVLPNQSQNGIQIQQTQKSEAFSTYNFTFVSNNAIKTPIDNNDCKGLKLTICKNNVQKQSKINKSRQRQTTSQFQKLDSDNRPIPNSGEELILNFVTGEWEVAPAEKSPEEPPQRILSQPNQDIVAETDFKFQMLPTLPKGSTILGVSNPANLLKKLHKDLPKREVNPEQISNDDIDDFAVAKRRKRTCQSDPSEIKLNAKSEYRVSSVDLFSGSPKLTLKKTSSASRGKPQLSKLVSATESEETSARRAKCKTKSVDDTDSSDSDFAPRERKKQRRLSKNINSDSDSDFIINDEPENIDNTSEDAGKTEILHTMTDKVSLEKHMSNIQNIYVLQPKFIPQSILVELDVTLLEAAVIALDNKVTEQNHATVRQFGGKNSREKPAASKRKITPISTTRSKSKSEKLSHSKSNASETEKMIKVDETHNKETSAPIPPLKIFRRGKRLSTERAALKSGVDVSPAEKTFSIIGDVLCNTHCNTQENLEISDMTEIRSLLEQCCDSVAKKMQDEIKEQIELNSKSEKGAKDDSPDLFQSDSSLINIGVSKTGNDVPNIVCTRQTTQIRMQMKKSSGDKTEPCGTPNSHNMQNDKSDQDGEDIVDPPSPPEKKSRSARQSCSFKDMKHVYKPAIKPPSRQQVMSDVSELGLASDSTSKPPFYGDASDAQSTCHRLTNLAPYIKKPKPIKTLQELEEYQSKLPIEGGLHHHMVMATASTQYTSSEIAFLRQRASDILPPNVRVWDHLDAVTKLPQYPDLMKIFLQDSEKREILLRPALKPPTRKEVEKWLDEKRARKLAQNSEPKSENKPENEIDVVELTTMSENHATATQDLVFEITPKPALRRSMSLTSPCTSGKNLSRRRRVSFDLSNISPENNKTFSPVQTRSQRFKKRKLGTIVGSPCKRTINIENSPLTAKDLPFANLTSPIESLNRTSYLLDSSMPFSTSPSFLSSVNVPVTPEGSSTAIKTLVGSSNSDETSPLTFLISGSFTPPDSSTQEPKLKNQDDPLLSSLKKLPQSTPNVTGTRQRKHALRKLAFTPIKTSFTASKEQDTPMKERTPPRLSRETSPVTKTSQGTPTTKTSLRKIVLAKQFQPPGTVNDLKLPSTEVKEPCSKHSLRNSPLAMDTPQTTTKKEGSQIDGPTLDNTYGFKAAQQHLGDAKSLHIVQHIKTLSIELHVKTRIDLRPDPDMDEIRCLFYCLDSDSWTGTSQGMKTGAIIVDIDSVKKESEMPDSQKQSTSRLDTTTSIFRELFKKSGITHIDTLYVRTEAELFLLFAQLIHEWDPDILVGYEVQMLSWGFLFQRAAHLRCDLCRAISRVPADEQRNRHAASGDAFGADNASELHVVGRLVLNLWRLMKTELALYGYTFENVAYHLLHERHPSYDHQTLTHWYDPPSRGGQVTFSHTHRWRVIDYYVTRVRANLRLLQQQDLVDRTSELARLFGIQFYDVLTRGTQFRVESMMLRTSRAHNLVAVTPSTLQRAQMRAPEVIALVLEPESKFYHVPVLVLDFQSLYPSMVIAYNICFSTCLGRVEHLGSDAVFTFGCTSLRVPAKTLSKLLRKNLITINPSGVAFVKSSVRKGVMPQMLDEILTTRIMVKNSMKKLGPADSAIKRMLDHRQLGLKLIANVTYGYTAANFSGRMPCVEVGDSIVHKARETLERAIHLVTRNSERWCNARVVYGDTDSMFVALEGVNNSGCSKDKAFKIGKEIAAAVTADNPTPVKLKFEKVYLPCVLQTKKRYVGYSYETEDQVEPMFDAKGIETVRRDGTPGTSKILEKMLKILFNTRDVSQVKKYVLKQCSKLLDGKTTLQDCIIAKEYRGKQYYKPGAVVPALNIARKLIAMDKRAEPRVGERVPYVIVHGAPGTPLYQLVRSPLEVLKDPSLHLNGAYYVSKQLLPALDRVLSLLGVDVFLWYRQLPRSVNIAHNPILDSSQNVAGKKATISQFFKSKHCLMCKNLSIKSICDECLATDNSRRQATAISLNMEAKALEQRRYHTEQVCMQCTGSESSSDIRCASLDCPILYKLHRAIDDSSKAKVIRKVLAAEDMMM